MVTVDEKYIFNSLMYADNLIIIATSSEGLQKSLNALNTNTNRPE